MGEADLLAVAAFDDAGGGHAVGLQIAFGVYAAHLGGDVAADIEVDAVAGGEGGEQGAVLFEFEVEGFEFLAPLRGALGGFAALAVGGEELQVAGGLDGKVAAGVEGAALNGEVARQGALHFLRSALLRGTVAGERFDTGHQREITAGADHTALCADRLFCLVQCIEAGGEEAGFLFVEGMGFAVGFEGGLDGDVAPSAEGGAGVTIKTATACEASWKGISGWIGVGGSVHAVIRLHGLEIAG